MNNKPEFDYFYGTEAEQFDFYNIPKMLFTDKRFKKISAEAKLFYSFLIEDKEMSVAEICNTLKFNDKKLNQIINELDSKKGVGLIECVEQEKGNSSIVYIKNFFTV